MVGIIRFCHAIPYFVAYYNIDGAEHPTLMVLWQALGIVGIAWGLLINLLILYGLGWSWMACILILSKGERKHARRQKFEYNSMRL